MLINSFGSLKAELARYMFHQRFAPEYDTATQNFEAVANRRLRVRPMETMTNLTTANGECPIPTDYLLWRAVIWGTSPDDEMDYVHPLYLKTTNVSPRLFTIEGNTFKTNPVDDTTDQYEFHYFQKIPTITSSDNASNWLLAAHSDLYLEGTLFELFVLGRNGEAGLAHKQLRDEKFTELIQMSALTTGASSSSVRESAEYF